MQDLVRSATIAFVCGRVRRHVMSVAVLDTDATRARGYQGARLPSQLGGMLFVFPDHGLREFHTRNVAFPLDFFFFNSGARLTKGIGRVAPGTDQVEGYGQWVLEVPSKYKLFPGVVRDGVTLAIT